MVTIQLFTRSGLLVHETTIPAPLDGEAPDIIAWGTRLFVAPDGDRHGYTLEDDDAVLYIEAHIYELPHIRGAQGDATGQP